jgi:hypothetical protein
MGTPQEHVPAPAQYPVQVSPLAAPMPDPPAYRLTPPPGSRLEALRAQLEGAKAARAEAESRERMIIDGMKSEAVALAPPGTASIIVAGGPGIPDWQVHYVEQWRLATKEMKEKSPVTYVTWARKVGGWRVDRVKG